MVIGKIIFANFRAIAGAVAAVATVIASPATANSSASADISAPLRATQSESKESGKSDKDFSKLFADWQATEGKTTSKLVNVSEGAQGALGAVQQQEAAVSIPSRMPLDGSRLTSDFGMRNHPISGRRRGHKGVDLASPVGTPIFATADGTVSKASWFSSYGLYVSLEHGGNIQTRYAHMSRLNVAAGQKVKKGEVIGFVGSTGRSTGPHLHYEVRVDGKAVNPIPYMQSDRLVEKTLSSGAQGGPEE